MHCVNVFLHLKPSKIAFISFHFNLPVTVYVLHVFPRVCLKYRSPDVHRRQRLCSFIKRTDLVHLLHAAAPALDVFNLALFGSPQIHTAGIIFTPLLLLKPLSLSVCVFDLRVLLLAQDLKGA